MRIVTAVGGNYIAASTRDSPGTGNMARIKTPPLPPSAEACEHLLEVIRTSVGPLPANSLARLLVAPFKITNRQLAPILDDYVAAGRLHVFPPKTAKGKPRYWDRDSVEFGRQAIISVIELKGPQTETQLKKAAKGLSEAQFQQILNRALAAGDVWRHPPLGKSKKELFGRRAPSPEPYLQDVGHQLTTIVTRLTEAKVSPTDLRACWCNSSKRPGFPSIRPQRRTEMMQPLQLLARSI